MKTHPVLFFIILLFLIFPQSSCDTHTSEESKQEQNRSLEEAEIDKKPDNKNQDQHLSQPDTKQPDENIKPEESTLETDILFIRDKFNIIANAKNYRSDSYSFECDGGEIYFERKYNEKEELVYLSDEYCGGHGCQIDQYYFWNGDLIFIFSKTTHWVGNTDSIVEHRTYFKKDQMIQCLEKEVSSENGDPKIEVLALNTKNQEVECTSDKKPNNLEELMALNTEEMEPYFCQ